MIKTRIFPDKNYKATFINGKTMRFAIDPEKPILDLDYPEFYDVKITGKCSGKCDFCYQDSKEGDYHYKNVVEKINKFFGAMDENQRPFQVAIGGGEPTSHPDFKNILKAFYKLGIMPNYTTNGMWIEESMMQVLNATGRYCGGVAVSCHSHLENYWRESAKLYADNGIMLNFHHIISDRDSIDEFCKIYHEWKHKVDYFVLLPYTAKGRAKHKEIDWQYLIDNLPRNMSKLAFGANFHPYLEKTPDMDVILYEPEIMSKFITMEGSGKMYKSSFENKLVKEGFLIC